MYTVFMHWHHSLQNWIIEIDGSYAHEVNYGLVLTAVTHDITRIHKRCQTLLEELASVWGLANFIWKKSKLNYILKNE